MSADTSSWNPPRNRIVFVNRYFFPDESATSRMLSDLAFRLARRGLSVSVITSRQLYADARAGLTPREVVNGVSVHRVATASYGRDRLAGRALDYASFHVAAGIELLRILKRGDVVVAKTDPPLISIVASRAANWRRAVFVNWLQDLFPEVASALAPDLMSNWLRGRLVTARDRSLRRAAMNVVLGERMRDRLMARDIDPARIRIIPNWADTAQVMPLRPADSVTRGKLGLTQRFVVGYSGNLGRAHEFETLLGAARLLNAESDVTFLMTGAGARSGGLKIAVAAQGLRNFVFQDYQPPELLADSLAAADVHLVSLLPVLEGLIVPSKVYGIMAAGRPAIFIGDTDGEVARLLRQHQCGISVGVGQSELLAAQLRALRNDHSRRQQMGDAARQLAVARYTSERAVADWIGFLKSIAPSVVGSLEEIPEGNARTPVQEIRSN